MKIPNGIFTYEEIIMHVSHFLLVFLVAFIVITVYEITTPSDEDRSRRTQMCQQAGEELDCMQYSTWAIGKECSCVVKNRRIKFNPRF